MPDRTIVLRHGEREYRVTVAEGGTVSVDGATAVPSEPAGDGEVRVGSAPPRVAWTAASGDTRWVFIDGEVFELEAQRGGGRVRAGAAHGSLSSPMPASVVRLEVAPGDTVRRGDTLIILEAMKMELPVRAPADGIVKAVHCKAGDLVQPDVPLIDIE